MIKLTHNITKDRFDRIDVDPQSTVIPDSIFEKKTGELNIIQREIPLKKGFRPSEMSITAYRLYTEEGVEYIQKYLFNIAADESGLGKFKDDYTYLSVFGGKFLKHLVYKPFNVKKELDKIKKLGFKNAKGYYDMLVELHQIEPEEYPFEDDGYPNKERFGDDLNSDLWDLVFDELEESPTYSRILDMCGTDRVGEAYFEGVFEFMDKTFVKKG